MEEILIKKANKNVYSELKSIGFDSAYLNEAEKKYKGNTYKIFNLKPYEANILKQTCLSLGFDCAVSRESVMCKCEKTDALIFATNSQLSKLTEKLNQQPFRFQKLSLLIKDALNNRLPELIINNRCFNWERPYIMGILNVTPDSFSDGGKYVNSEEAIKHALQLIQDGADIIDIGGESTRPNAEIVCVEEEIKRVLPVIKELRQNNPDIPISIDTRNYETAKAAVEAGANIINDVSGLDYDKKLYEFVTLNNIPVVIMHSDKVPAVSSDCTNNDIVEEVYLSLYKKINKMISDGMREENIIADTGIGFGKSAQSNFELLKRTEEFTSLNVPLLLGISRKSFIRNKFELSFEEADTVTALYSSTVKGINIHRVHNVKLTKQYLTYTSEVL